MVKYKMIQKLGVSLLFIFLVIDNIQAQFVISAKEVEHLKTEDPTGVGMAITAMGVVFISLFLLYFVFKYVGNIAVRLSQRRVMKASGLTKEQAKDIASESGAIYAAIAMAIHEITEDEHDDENTVLTIKNVARNYSPWSSKIYTLRQLPRN